MNKRIISALLAIIVILSLYLIRINIYDDYDYNNSGEAVTADYGQLKAHFIDVGQGDSCFIELPNSETMLIDSGEAKYSGTVSNYISTLGYNKINYVVATHGDADHIGGLAEIFENFDIENCYTSYVESETKTYQKFKNAVEYEGIELQKPYSGDFIVDERDLDVKVVGPSSSRNLSDTNDASVVILISFYSYDFLFTGDAPADVLDDYNIGDIEVLKASHHGSRTGVSKSLINELSPEYSVISVAAKSKYNHPHEETLELLKDSEIYKTSDCGTIIAVCEQTSLEFITEK